MLVLERGRAAVEHDLTVRNARAELAKAESKARRQRPLAQRNELGGRIQKLADRMSDDAARAHAEQALRCSVQLSDQERVVEHDERDRQSLDYVAGIGCALRPPRPAERLEPRR